MLLSSYYIVYIYKYDIVFLLANDQPKIPNCDYCPLAMIGTRFQAHMKPALSHQGLGNSLSNRSQESI